MRTLVLFTLLSGFALCDAQARAEGTDRCSLTDEQFLQQLTTMKSWPEIHAVYKRNLPACADDGVYGEGYTEVVVVALARRWSELGELQRFANRDPAFRRFVYHHIDASADEGDLRKVANNARTMCPPNARPLCDEIATRADAAIGVLK